MPHERAARILQNPRSTALIARFDDAHDCRQHVVAHSNDFTIRLDGLQKPERMRIAPKSAGHLAPDRRTTCCRKTVAWDRQHDPHKQSRLRYTDDDVGNGTWVQNIVPVRKSRRRVFGPPRCETNFPTRPTPPNISKKRSPRLQWVEAVAHCPLRRTAAGTSRKVGGSAPSWAPGSKANTMSLSFARTALQSWGLPIGLGAESP